MLNEQLHELFIRHFKVALEKPKKKESKNRVHVIIVSLLLYNFIKLGMNS